MKTKIIVNNDYIEIYNNNSHLNIKSTKLTVFCGYGIDNIIMGDGPYGNTNNIIYYNPENNCHPKIQRQIAKDIAKQTNAKTHKKIVLFTHSDYIIKDLNIMIMANNKPNKKEFMLKNGYKHTLDFNKITAYEINNKINIANVTCDGIAINTFDKEINHMNMIADELIWGN